LFEVFAFCPQLSEHFVDVHACRIAYPESGHAELPSLIQPPLPV
jgi:hypothetical protein